jgi:hypothetical protein
MRRTILLITSLIAGAAGFGALGGAHAQNSTRGCGSPIVLNSRVNQLHLVCGQSNPDLARVVARLNELAARKVLAPADLQTIATALNAKIDKVSNDTDEILILLREVLGRLEIASSDPGRAPVILRPYLEAATDISNRAYDVSEFLDAEGKAEYRFVFRLQGNCQLFIRPPARTGFIVGVAILSDRGSSIWRALSGTQGRYRPIPLSTGTYQFVMYAKRGAGQHSATISSRCD